MPGRDSTTIKVATTFSTSATPSNPENFTYQTRVVTGPRYTNVFALIEVPDGEVELQSRAERRLRVGELAPVEAQRTAVPGWTRRAARPTTRWRWRDVPASTNLYVEVLTPFELDPNRVSGLARVVGRQRGQHDCRCRSSDFQLHVTAH